MSEWYHKKLNVKMVGKEKNLNLGIGSDQIGSNGGVNETQFVEFHLL